MRPTHILRGGGPRIPYPEHVWSPAGGWYGNPANWRTNTAICLVVMFGCTAALWKISAELEHRDKMPQPGRFYASRYWSKQVVEHERAQKAVQEKNAIEAAETAS